MDIIATAREGYSRTARQIRPARGLEHEVFARITARLRAAAEGEGGFAALAAALHDNRQLWALLAADVAGEGNALPAPLRARLWSLAQFTFRHSSKVLAQQAGPEVLVEINTAVMNGLRGGGTAG